jgi:hypothetical protein
VSILRDAHFQLQHSVSPELASNGVDDGVGDEAWKEIDCDIRIGLTMRWRIMLT